MNFSSLNRPAYLQTLQTQTFDVLIIGGGITGAGIALDAATRGLKVALIEKKDFAWGTSSRSTKLIHGGLRYLKQLEIQLVREVGLERAIVHRNARHLVIPEKMLLPIVQGGSLGKTMSSLGLWVYDYLAKVEKSEKRKMLDKSQTQAQEPLVRTDILKAGGLYYEYRTDDARLTIENIKSAVEKGAVCLNYAQAESFLYDDNDQIVGAKVSDLSSLAADNQPFEIKAKYVVNAGGAWVDTLRAKDKEGVQKKHLHLTKGVHIVVPYERLPLQQSAYFDTPDKRMCFAVPRFGVTYIGTTDTNYQQDIDNPNAELSDVEYILKATNAMFPTVALTTDDVISTWAGLRPLIHQAGKSPSELSRKDEIFVSKTGLLSMAGGKLTGYRKMAERVVNLICKKMGISRACVTSTLQISGAGFDSNEAFDKFVNLRAGSVRDLGVAPEHIVRLAQKYGTNTDWIIEKAYALAPLIKNGQERIEAAEIHYAVEEEMITNLSDYLIRRTGRLYFERPSIQQLLPIWNKHLSSLLKWSPETEKAQTAEFLQAYEAVMSWQQPVLVS